LRTSALDVAIRSRISGQIWLTMSQLGGKVERVMGIEPT